MVVQERRVAPAPLGTVRPAPAQESATSQFLSGIIGRIEYFLCRGWVCPVGPRVRRAWVACAAVRLVRPAPAAMDTAAGFRNGSVADMSRKRRKRSGASRRQSRRARKAPRVGLSFGAMALRGRGSRTGSAAYGFGGGGVPRVAGLHRWLMTYAEGFHRRGLVGTVVPVPGRASLPGSADRARLADIGGRHLPVAVRGARAVRGGRRAGARARARLGCAGVRRVRVHQPHVDHAAPSTTAIRTGWWASWWWRRWRHSRAGGRCCPGRWWRPASSPTGARSSSGCLGLLIVCLLLRDRNGSQRGRCARRAGHSCRMPAAGGFALLLPAATALLSALLHDNDAAIAELTRIGGQENIIRDLLRRMERGGAPGAGVATRLDDLSGGGGGVRRPSGAVRGALDRRPARPRLRAVPQRLAGCRGGGGGDTGAAVVPAGGLRPVAADGVELPRVRRSRGVLADPGASSSAAEPVPVASGARGQRDRGPARAASAGRPAPVWPWTAAPLVLAALFWTSPTIYAWVDMSHLIRCERFCFKEQTPRAVPWTGSGAVPSPPPSASTVLPAASCRTPPGTTSEPPTASRGAGWRAPAATRRAR